MGNDKARLRCWHAASYATHRPRGAQTLAISAQYSAWGSPASSAASATVGVARGLGRRTRFAFAWLQRTGATVLVHKALPLQRHRKAKYV